MLRRGFTDTYAYIEKEDWNQQRAFQKTENIHQRKLKEGTVNDKIGKLMKLKLYTQVYSIHTSV